MSKEENKDGPALTGLSIETALYRLTERIRPIDETVTVPLDKAMGAVNAEAIHAPEAVPSFRRAAMDGYAVRVSDIAGASEEKPAQLKVADELCAGDFRVFPYASGSAVRIMTGAAVPDVFDAVVKQEDTDQGDKMVSVFTPAEEGMNICPLGEEFSKGALAIPARSRIGRIGLGILASFGMTELTVIRSPRVAVLSTGSELVAPGDIMLPGHIYGSISFMLRASIQGEGFEVSYDRIVGDDKELMKKELKAALECSDLVLTTGGVSVGKKDLMHDVLDEIGAQKLFYLADIQPGTPTIGSICGGKVILSLSGNPYAALANFDYYFFPLVARLMGCDAYLKKTKEAILADPYEKVNRSRRLVRAYEENGQVFLRAAGHKSSMFGNLTNCNCYMDVPAGVRLSLGDRVTIRCM